MMSRKVAPLAMCFVELLRAALFFWTFLAYGLSDPAAPFSRDVRLLAAVLGSAQLLPALAWFAVWRGESPALLAWTAFPAHLLNLAGLSLRYGALLSGGAQPFSPPGSAAVLSSAGVLLSVLLDSALLWLSLRMARAETPAPSDPGPVAQAGTEAAAGEIL